MTAETNGTGEGVGTVDDNAITIPLLPGRSGSSRPGGVPGGGAGGLVLRLRVLPTAWLLIGVHLAVTGSRLARSWWWQDDLNLLALARHRLDPTLLLTDYNGHLVPGTFVLGWLIDRIGALAWWPAALFVLLLMAGCDLTLLALLRRLFGTRPGILVPLAMFCSTTLTLTSTVWWAAAMQWLPVTLSLVLALYGQVSYFSTGRTRYAVLAVGSVAFGLAFFEKALTTTVVLALFAVLYSSDGNWLQRPWRLFLAKPVYWLAHVGVAVGFVALYLSTVRLDSGGSSASAAHGIGDYLTLIRYMLLETLVPSLLGGPFRWYSTPDTTVNAWPMPPLWFAAITWLIAAAVIVLSIRSRPGAWRAWTLLGTFLVMSMSLVAKARLDFVGPFIGRDHRYVSDAAMLASVCLALALMPLLPGFDRARREAGLSRGDLSSDGPTRDPLDGSLVDPTRDPLDGSLVDPTRDPLDGSLVDPTRDPLHDPAPADDRSAPVSAAAGAPGTTLTRRAARTGTSSRNPTAAVRARPQTGARGLLTSPGVGLAVVLLMTVGGIVSGETFMKVWTLNPTQPYFDNLRTSLAASTGPVYLFPEETVPDLVMTPTFEDSRQLRNVGAVLDRKPLFRDWAPAISMVKDDGTIVPAAVDAPATMLAAPACADASGRIVVRLPGPVQNWRWKIELGYLAASPTKADVRLGLNGPRVHVEFAEKLGNIYLDTETGPAATIVIDNLGAGAGLCIGTVAIGKELKPAPPPS